MTDDQNVRVYGMADQAGREPPAAQGVRGARSTTQPRQGDPDLSHEVTLDSGKTVTVSEGSGVAFAEATGRAGRGADAGGEGEFDVTFTPDDHRSRRRWPLLLGALAAGVAGGAWLARRARSHEPERMRLVVIRPATPILSWPASRI